MYVNSEKCINFATSIKHKKVKLPTKKSVLTQFFVSLCLIGTDLQAADKKIIVLADIHVMAPSLVDNTNNSDWQTYLATSKTMQNLSAPIFDTMTETIIREKPDLLLIVGDLTKDSEVESHEYVLKNLTRIKNSGVKTYVIPGNHDRGWMERALIYRNDSSTPAEMIDNDGFMERYENFGYGSETEHFGSTLNYVAEPFPGLTLIGVDSGIWVTYREGSIDWVCEKAKEAQAKGNLILLMVHHPIMPHYYYQNRIFELSVAENYEEIREKFLNAGIKVVLTGHTHASDITRYTDNQGREIYDVGTGSPISYPCDYRILTINDTDKTLNIRTNSLTQLDGYDNFQDYAEDRLRNSLNNWMKQWFNEKIEVDEDNELLVSIMTQALSNAFVIHAIGNEAENPDAAESAIIYNDLLRYLPRLDIPDDDIIKNISLSMKSLLGDYPSEEETENVVNDRELTIQLSAVSDDIHEITLTDEAKDEQWFSLLGTQLSGRPVQPGIYLHRGKKVLIK